MDFSSVNKAWSYNSTLSAPLGLTRWSVDYSVTIFDEPITTLSF